VAYKERDKVGGLLETITPSKPMSILHNTTLQVNQCRFFTHLLAISYNFDFFFPTTSACIMKENRDVVATFITRIFVTTILSSSIPSSMGIALGGNSYGFFFSDFKVSTLFYCVVIMLIFFSSTLLFPNINKDITRLNQKSVI
jgi:hypothetical protein